MSEPKAEARHVEQVLDNAFYGAEDALTEFVMTGKADFKKLADSILSDIMRVTIRMAILGPISQALGAGLGSMFGGGAGAAASPMTSAP